MKKANRLLSVILAVALLIGAAIPNSLFASAGEETEPLQAYESTLRNVSDMVNDGWKGFYSSDPQAGIPFENQELGYLFECWSGGITRTQKGTIKWNNDWSGNPFNKMGAATYTAKKYKYFTLTVEYKFQKNETPWPVVTFGQPNETPEMFYVKINGSQVSDPKYNKNVVGTYIQYEGHLNVSGKNALAGANSSSNIDGSQWHKLTLKVTQGKVYSAISDLEGNPLVETNSSLSSGYEAGYISLMLNGLAFFRNFSIVEEEDEEEEIVPYENNLRNTASLMNDGWKAAYSSDPQAGVPFEAQDLDYLFECWSKGITRTQKGNIKWVNDYEGNPFSRMGAATYTAKKYKYFTLSVNYKFNKSDSPWPAVVFGQPNEIPEMFYADIATSAVENPVGGNDAIGVFMMYEGHINISGKNANGGSNITNALVGTSYHTLTVTVQPGSVTAVVYNDDGTVANEVTTELSNAYEGGYISLMLNGLAFFQNLSITELDFDTGLYSTDLRNVESLKNDGWSGAYSADPQDAVEFEDIDASELFECWSGGITRKQNKYYHWKGFNWKDPFINMGALTYTAQKYKYFTMTVDYKFGGRNNVWPAITFGQPETTPEMFYAPIAYSDVQSNPKEVSNDAIGVYVQYEGYLNIAGKNATGASNVNAFDTTDWHTMKISVVPGMVEVVLYDNDGNPVSTTTAILSDEYEGGYVSLMMGVPYSFFRNFSITEYEYLDMSQTESSDEISTKLTKKQCKKPIIVKATPKRLYDFESINLDEESGAEYEIKNITSDIYLIEEAKPSVLTVKYAERKLDYDPEYTLKYYFDWEEDLNDFVAYRTPNPTDSPIESASLSDIWKIRNGILQKPVIDFTGTDKTSDPWSDFNILMLNTYQFRNFELTVQYKHGRKGGFACGVIFGIEDPTYFIDQEEGGIFAAVESDARGLLNGKSIRNRNDLLRIMPGQGFTNLPGYPQYDTTQIHTMKLKVIEGRAYMYIDDIEEPVTAIIPKDYYGNIALAVGNNLGWFDNLTIQPLNEWGEKVTLAESELHYLYNSEDVETDSWSGDNSEWGESPIDYFEVD